MPSLLSQVSPAYVSGPMEYFLLLLALCRTSGVRRYQQHACTYTSLKTWDIVLDCSVVAFTSIILFWNTLCDSLMPGVVCCEVPFLEVVEYILLFSFFPFFLEEFFGIFEDLWCWTHLKHIYVLFDFFLALFIYFAADIFYYFATRVCPAHYVIWVVETERVSVSDCTSRIGY